jgi:pimeloyl-ACP methyl ester carboxylesterase
MCACEENRFGVTMTQAEGGMDEELPEESVHVVLVHGTFARNATWTEPSSALCASIAQHLAGHSVRFHRPQWSGANNHRDRVSAGAELARYVLELIEWEPAPCFLVGHSHGGTVITQALRQSPELAEVVEGSIFLSTPFIQIRRKDYYKDLMRFAHFFVMVFVWAFVLGTLIVGGAALSLPRPLILAGFPACMILSMVLFWGAMHAQSWRDVGQKFLSNRSFLVFASVLILIAATLDEFDVGWKWMPILRWLIVWGGGLLGGLAAVIFVIKCVGPDKPEPGEKPLRLEQAIAATEDLFDIRNMRADRALFIRGNSDEANAGLVWIQVVHRLWSLVIALPLRVVELVTNFTLWPAIWRRQRRPFRILLGVLAGLVLGPALFILVGVIVVGSWDAAFRMFGAADPYQVMKRFNSFANSISVLDVLFPAFAALGYASLGSYPLMLGCLAIGSLGLVTLGRAFGGWFVFTSAFLEISIEPVPPGRWRLLQIRTPDPIEDWHPLATAGRAHAVYLSAEAQDAVGTWIRSRREASAAMSESLARREAMGVPA